jgi:hypothetical protein
MLIQNMQDQLDVMDSDMSGPRAASESGDSRTLVVAEPGYKINEQVSLPT